MISTSYIVEVNAGILFLYGVYSLLLRNETDFTKQRAFLNGSLLCALLFPLIQIPVAANKATQVMSMVMLPELVVNGSATPAFESSFDVLLLLYISIAISVSIPLIIQGVKLYRATIKLNGRYYGSYYVIESDDNRPSWSFFRLIFIGRSAELCAEEKDLIMKHEMLHGKLYHSIDMLFATLLCIAFWFNPVVWIYRRTLAKVHEFEVDSIIAEQNGAVGYSVLLAKTALSSNGLLLTHHFNQSFILKRINMINMIKNKVSNWKFAALITAVAIYFVGVSCGELAEKPMSSIPKGAPDEAVREFTRLKEKYPDAQFGLLESSYYMSTKDLKPGTAVIMVFAFPEKDKSWLITENSGRTNEVYVMADQTAEPVFGIQAFYKQLGDALQYPAESARQGIEGKVFVEFVINTDGHLSDFVVKKGLNEECDTEAIRAIMQLGNWKPGYQNKRAIAQRLVLPIVFKLNN
jgi:TonB family protein